MRVECVKLVSGIVFYYMVFYSILSHSIRNGFIYDLYLLSLMCLPGVVERWPLQR